VVRNKAAEICEKTFIERDKIYVEGRIKSRQWQDRWQNIPLKFKLQFTFCPPKASENNKQIDSPESVKTLTLTHKIMVLINDLPFWLFNSFLIWTQSQFKFRIYIRYRSSVWFYRNIVLLLCSALAGAEVALFSLSQRHWRNTRDDSKGRILADLIDRPKNF
jgi:hypothetical protein